jgi:DNA-binding NarL/FixJ family response regulator
VRARVYICDINPRMRDLIAERLGDHAEIVGSGDTAADAVEDAAHVDADLVVRDFRTAVGHLEQTIAGIKQSRPSAAVVVHTGVPRELIEEQVAAAGGVYSPKNEPEHLLGLVRGIRPAVEESASQGS